MLVSIVTLIVLMIIIVVDINNSINHSSEYYLYCNVLRMSIRINCNVYSNLTSV